MLKDVKKKGEAAKLQFVTSVVMEMMHLMKLKGSDVSEDEIKNLEDELQKMTDKYVKEIDRAVEVNQKKL